VEALTDAVGLRAPAAKLSRASDDTEEKALSNSTYTKEELWGELERLGESAVRVRFTTGFYGSAGRRRVFVEEWLQFKQAAREQILGSRNMGRPDRTSAAAGRATEAAEQAAKAADRQALAAESANRRALIALVFAAISLPVAIVSVAINVILIFKLWH
jgi:hypothetical protein